MKKLIIALVIVIVAATGILYKSRKVNAPDASANNSSTTDTTVANKHTLDKSGKGLTKVDATIYNQTDLTSLNLSNNSLTSLPSEMGRLTKLQVLRLDNNKIEGSLIGEIRLMSDLRVLSASGNNMSGLPAEIGQLNKLVELDLSNNKLTELPNELRQLTGLKKLNLSGNKVSASTIDGLHKALTATTIVE